MEHGLVRSRLVSERTEAVAAMALGTESIKSVDMIVGPRQRNCSAAYGTSPNRLSAWARCGDASMNSLTGSGGYRWVRSLLFGRSVDLRNISYLLHGLYGLCACHQCSRSTAFNGAPRCDR
jgi:hypothetical protein